MRTELYVTACILPISSLPTRCGQRTAFSCLSKCAKDSGHFLVLGAIEGHVDHAFGIVRRKYRLKLWRSLVRNKTVARGKCLDTGPTPGPSTRQKGHRALRTISARAPCFDRPASCPPGGFELPRACATRSALARSTVPVQDTRRHRACCRSPRIPRHPRESGRRTTDVSNR